MVHQSRSIAAALFATALLGLAPLAGAQDETTVAAVQMPAWVEREGRVLPVRPGFVMRPGDVLLTGGRGRVHIDTPDGSIVKLGSDGRIGFNELKVRPEAGESLFEGVLNVAKGAFRFTTRLAGRASRRDVRVRVGVVTAGVRGTDIWGKSDDAKDLVCLLEGKISVTSDGAPEQQMTEALSFYVVPKGAPPNPIGPVDVNKVVNEWAPQTELAPDGASLTADGRFRVVLMSRTSANAALWLAERLNAVGYPAEAADLGDGTARLQIAGFASREDAERFTREIEGVQGIRGAFVAGG